MKKIISISIILVLIVSFATVVFAKSNNNSKYKPVTEYTKIEKNVAGIKKHINLINEKNKNIEGARIIDVIGTITFLKKLSIGEVSNYIEKHHIKSVDKIWAKQGETTFYSKNTLGLEETHKKLGNLENAYTAIYVYVDSDNIKEIIKDEITYLADFSGDGFYYGKTDSKGENRNGSGNMENNFPHPLHNYVYDELLLTKN